MDIVYQYGPRETTILLGGQGGHTFVNNVLLRLEVVVTLTYVNRLLGHLVAPYVSAILPTHKALVLLFS